MTTDNIYKVPKNAWKTWNEDGREVFNHLYSMILENQKLFTHPKLNSIPQSYWTTTAWNAAWMAAEEVNKRT